MKLLTLILTLIFSASALADCTYTVDKDKVNLTWTAYKLPSKVGVNGTFSAIDLKGSLKGNSLAKIIDSTSVKINHQSVVTKNKDRDQKIMKWFFKPMKGKSINASFKVISGKNSGEVDMNLSMNGETHTIPLSYSVVDGNKLKMEGILNVLAFNLSKSLDGINKACLEQHQKSYTWADVKLLVEVGFNKTCK